MKTLNRALLVVKLARPRTWIFAIISYLFGYMATDAPTLWQILVGGVIFALGTAATNLINVYTDVEEDAINLASRTEMVNEVGRTNLAYAPAALYLLILLLSVPFGLNFVLIILLAEFDSIGYSLPPLRFKRHPASALLSFSGAVGLPLLAGIVVAGKSILNPLLPLLASFMFAYGTVKNIPDILGDIKSGLRTTATVSASLKRTVETSTILLLIPYILLSSMVVLDILSPIYLANLIFLPFLVYWTAGNIRTSNTIILEQLHTFGFVYAVCFLLFNLIITYPSQASIGMAISALSFIFLVSRLGVDSRIQNPLAKYREQSLGQKGESFGTNGS